MENNNKLGEYPAFPIDEYLGMSKHFYATCAAMQGLCSSNIVGVGSFDFNTSADNKIKQIIRISRLLADEIIKQENGE